MQRVLLFGLLCVVGLVPALAEESESDVFTGRVLYAPAHFGNSYEVMGEREMRACLVEAKHWGFNEYADWFDTVDCSDPFVSRYTDLGRALWQRKKANYRTAQDLGLRCTLLMTPNHVFLDQCKPGLTATKGDDIFGQLLCPSVPEARATILKNYENLFADLAKHGVRLSALSACPYDYGGCACETCAPWILTFARLTREIHAIADRHHPGVEMHFVGWWWDPVEHEQFAEWVDTEAPGWARSMYLHIPYGETNVADVPLPEGCERRAFVHIGYADEASPKDVYGHLGPVIAADRLERTVNSLREGGCTGVMAYSEGVYEDVNKAILAALTSAAFATSDEALRAYAKRYLSADDDAAARWADWLRKWGRPYTVNADDMAAGLETLRPDTVDWRYSQWEAKTTLMQRYAEVAAGTEWSPERLAAADAFWAEQERMQRQIYGLGPLRHILNRRFSPFPWYRSWAEHAAKR